jgi:hypothetical protein
MEWAIPAGLIGLLVLACPLMMLGMMAFGWLFMRGRSGGGHGMMMCMGHGQHDADHQGPHAAEPANSQLVEELKVERQRLDALIARAEGERGQ